MSGCSPSLHACWSILVLSALNKNAQTFIPYMVELVSSQAVVGVVTFISVASGLSSGICLLLLFPSFLPVLAQA